ncbi:hypothetical protein QQ045_010660 [Rhodiola kirilowii]
MRNVRNALASVGLQDQIKVSTAIWSALLSHTYPPSDARFRDDIRSYIDPIVNFLDSNGYINNTRDISLPYALFTAPSVVVTDANNGLRYQNLFDALVDSVYAALSMAGGPNVPIVVSETGWPSVGHAVATPDNAAMYLRRLIGHMQDGTPRRRHPLETYKFAMFDENQKTGDQDFEEDARAFWKVRNEKNRSAAAGTPLRFHAELLGSDKITCTEEEWAECAGVWAWALVGIVFDFKPSLGRMKSFVRTRWGDESTVMVVQMKPRVFLFNFSNQEEMVRVKDQGPWTLDNKPMVLQRWTPDETFELESVDSIPIWVRFPGMAPHMRKEPLLSKIASVIGSPIKTDGFTSSGDKMMYERVLIEVIRVEEDEEEDVRVVIEPEERCEEEKFEDVPIEVLMRNVVTNVNSSRKDMNGSAASSSHTSVVPETAPSIRVDSCKELNAGKGMRMEISSSFEWK